MLTDNYACNPRNKMAGSMFFDKTKDVYTPNIEVDYRDEDVSPQSILNLFRGRYPPDVTCTSFNSPSFLFLNVYKLMKTASLRLLFRAMQVKNL